MASTSEGSSSKMFGPLTFEDTKTSLLPLNEETICLLCDNTFNLILGFDIFIKHLFEVHNLVIEEVQHIENLTEYLKFWKEKFQTDRIEEIIPSIRVESSQQPYFLLSTLLKEDKELRHKLKLAHALQVQEFERTDPNYAKQCLFCRLSFEGTRPDFLQHLATAHNLQLGNPQNLVYIEELIEQVSAKMDALQCLFCDRQFPERNILKEHMRKKLHKRINRHNKDYDRFYMVNYLESDRKWRAIAKEDDNYAVSDGVEANSDVEYSDWNEQEDEIICLFCAKKEPNINLICLHMDADHGFDFADLTSSFDFYQKIKFVNYVRRQVHQFRCFYCDEGFEKVEALERHLGDKEHFRLPEMKVFDQPEFYFPTYENDAFLYFIDDVED